MEGHDTEIDYYNNFETKPYVGAIILVLTFMVLGIIGNVHVLFVYTFRMKATSHRIFIIALAILDLLSCTISMPFITADMLHRLTFNAAVACRILRFFLYVFAGSSGFLLLPIAIDRYLKTCRPFGEQINPKRAKLLCAVVLAFCILSFWPIPVLYGHSTVLTPNPNITGVSCYLDDAFKESVYLTYWNGIMLIMAICMVFGLVVLYYMIGKSIRKHVQAKNKLLVQGQTNKIPGKSQQHASGCEVGDLLHKQRKHKGSSEKENVELKMYSNSVNNESFIPNVEPIEVSFNTENESKRESTTANTHIDYETNTSTIDVEFPVEKNEDELNDKDTSRDETTKQSELLNTIASGYNRVQLDKKEHITVNDIIDNNHVDVLNNKEKSEEQTGTCRKKSRKHREALQNLKRSNRTTKMFFAITILYFVTFVPHLILQLITLTQDDFVASLSFTGQTVYHIVFYCSFLNSMVNCYVYGFFDTMFRDELRKIYIGKFCIIKRL